MFGVRKSTAFIVAAMIFVFVCGLINHEWKAMHGYCFVEDRYVSETEYSVGVADTMVDWIETNLSGLALSFPKNFLNGDKDLFKYVDAEHFTEINPHCCEDIFKRNSRVIGPFFDEYHYSKIFDQFVYSKDVEFKYQVQSDKKAVATVKISPCGKSFLVSYVDF